MWGIRLIIRSSPNGVPPMAPTPLRAPRGPGCGSYGPQVAARVRQVEGLLAAASEDYERERLRERSAPAVKISKS